MPFDVSDVSKLTADLNRTRLRVGRQSAAVVRDAAFRVEASAKSRVPVQSGELRGSIDTRFYGSGNSGRMSAVVRAGAFYARFVEDGTSRQAPQPFMQPALNDQRAKFLAAITRLSDVLK